MPLNQINSHSKSFDSNPKLSSSASVSSPITQLKLKKLQEALTQHYSKEQLTQLGIIIPSIEANNGNARPNLQTNENLDIKEKTESNKTIFNTMPRQKHVNSSTGANSGINNSAFFYSPASFISNNNNFNDINRNLNSFSQNNTMKSINTDNKNSNNFSNTPNSSFNVYDSNGSRSKYQNMRDYRYERITTLLI